VVLALRGEYQSGHWVGFPLAALWFVPLARCPTPWPFLTQIDLAERLRHSLRWPATRLIIVVDNLYAKAQLIRLPLLPQPSVLVSRLRTNAALYLPPPPRTKPPRGRPRVRGLQVGAPHL
jgi:hypothetical protein